MGFSQSPSSSEVYEKEYYDLMNYKPESLKSDTLIKPNSKLLKSDLYSIGGLKIHYDYKDVFKFDEYDIKWLENRIEQLAIALFLEKKHIYIEIVGGYSGCPDKMIEFDEKRNASILKFCYSCTDDTSNGNRFLSIFNHRMDKLISENQ